MFFHSVWFLTSCSTSEQWQTLSQLVPGSVWRRRRRRSPLPPWTALPAWPGWCSPRTYWPDLYAGGWSTCPRCGWTHPDRQTGGETDRWEAVQVWDRQQCLDGRGFFFFFLFFYLPHGFDPLLEQVEVTVSAQVTWTDQMTVEPPELLHLTHSMGMKAAEKHSFTSLWMQQGQDVKGRMLLRFQSETFFNAECFYNQSEQQQE